MSTSHNGEASLAASALNNPLLEVEEGYERWAPIYDQAPNPVLAREERHVLPLLPSLGGKNALDLACGTGRWLEKLLARGVRLGVGVDHSGAMLRVANQNLAIQGKLTRADCPRLPFRRAAFDFGICSFAIGHVDGLRSMVCEIARVMRPMSDVFISDLHPEAYARGWQTTFRDEQGAVRIKTRSRTAEDIIRVFHSAGFECVTHVALCLGEEEKQFFLAANKLHLFSDACRVPAVLFCRFRLARSKE